LFWIGSMWSREGLPEHVIEEHEKTCVNSRCVLKKKYAPLGAELTRIGERRGSHSGDGRGVSSQICAFLTTLPLKSCN